MSYKSSRYKQGISGRKPSWIQFDEEGHKAQESGYRDHLANKDLVEKLREDRQERSSGYSYSSEPAGPLSRGQRSFWGVVFLAVEYVSASVCMSHFKCILQEDRRICKASSCPLS